MGTPWGWGRDGVNHSHDPGRGQRNGPCSGRGGGENGQTKSWWCMAVACGVDGKSTPPPLPPGQLDWSSTGGTHGAMPLPSLDQERA